MILNSTTPATARALENRVFQTHGASRLGVEASPGAVQGLHEFPILRFEHCVFLLQNTGQLSVPDRHVDQMDMRVRRNGAIFSCIHRGSGFPQIVINAILVQMVTEVGFGVESSKFCGQRKIIRIFMRGVNLYILVEW
jgi:hypothetical protein